MLGNRCGLGRGARLAEVEGRTLEGNPGELRHLRSSCARVPENLGHRVPVYPVCSAGLDHPLKQGKVGRTRRTLLSWWLCASGGRKLILGMPLDTQHGGSMLALNGLAGLLLVGVPGTHGEHVVRHDVK